MVERVKSLICKVTQDTFESHAKVSINSINPYSLVH